MRQTGVSLLCLPLTKWDMEDILFLCLKLENDDDYKASFLDLDVQIDNGEYKTHTYMARRMRLSLI